MDTSLQANSEPLVTIGLPTYNRPDGLKKCLECIGNQTYTNLEIIISNNCSTNDRVQQIIDAFASEDSRVKTLKQPLNLGLEENFNVVFEKSTAEYFMWMSDDDYFDGNYIAECVKFLEKNKDHVLCSGVAKYYRGDHFLFKEEMFLLNQPTRFDRLYIFFSKVDKNGGFYGVFRNRLFLEKPINSHIGSDWSFMAKLAILGKLAFVDSTNYHRSADGNSGTRQKMVKKFKLNKMQGLFFETYSAYLIATNIFNDSTVHNKFNYLQRKGIVIMIFFQINYKLFMKFVRKEMRALKS